MPKEQKMLSAFSNILYVKEGIRIAPKDLRSTKEDKVLSEETLNIIAKYEPYFSKIEEIVEFIDDIRNPFGIYTLVREYAHANGTQHYKKVMFTNNDTGAVYEKEIDDYYEPNDPDEYVMIIIDHISLISPETKNGSKTSVREAIVDLSSNYLIKLRNKYNYIPVVVQQQAAAQESIENLKASRLKPTLDGLGDSKLTARDANLIIGLFSPFRHEMPLYLDYDIKIFKDNIRFMEIVGGREGGGGTICPLYFDGAVNYFRELPLPTDHDKIRAVYRHIDNIRT